MNDSCLTVVLKPSKLLIYLNTLFYSLAALGLMYSNISFSIELSTIVVLGLLYRYEYQTQQISLCLHYRAESGWVLLDNDQTVAIEILKSSIITSKVTFLYFKKQQTGSWQRGIKVLPILRSTLPDNDYQRLLLLLRSPA